MSGHHSVEELPPPMVPADADLRDFPYVPLEVDRLLTSNFFTTATDAEFRAGLVLWLKAWRQVPAGSLPAEESALCRLADFGNDRTGWAKVSARALHGWRLCSDGRLYHAVVAEKVLEAWIAKVEQRRTSLAGAAARWGLESHKSGNDEIARAEDMLAALNPSSRRFKKRRRSSSNSNSVSNAVSNADGIPSAMPAALPAECQEEGGSRKWDSREDRILSECRKAAGVEGSQKEGLWDPSPILLLIDDFGVDYDAHVLPTLRARQKADASNFKYWTSAICEAAGITISPSHHLASFVLSKSKMQESTGATRASSVSPRRGPAQQRAADFTGIDS